MLEHECKTCGGRFSEMAHLVDHWRISHQDVFCQRCNRPKARGSKKIFCFDCEKSLAIPQLVQTPLNRIDRHLLRTEKRAARWNNRLENLLLLRKTQMEKNVGFLNGQQVELFCGHGKIKGQCQPCNPIFEKMTAEGFAKATDNLYSKLRLASEKKQKPKQEIIEVELD